MSMTKTARRWRRAWAGVLAAATVLVVPAAAAWADVPTGGTSGSANGQVLISRVRYDLSRNYPGPGGGRLTDGTGGQRYDPPACWYEPRYTPEQFKAVLEGIWASPSVSNEWVVRERDYYVNGNPYTNFQIGQAGMWWGLTLNQDMLGTAAAQRCITSTGQHEWDRWVPAGGTVPPSPTVPGITTEILARLAQDQIRVPDTRVTMNPAGRQTVNLSTWMWLDDAVFRDVAVTASLDQLGLSATTTATPVSLHLEPGTPDATVFPGSGDCPIVGGRIGQPRQRGASGDPPCGVTYRHASTGGPFQLSATLTWRISWAGSDGNGGSLGDGTFQTTLDIAVQEIQTYVRGSQ